jgi:nucleotide-binding universal stress UspA family protein
LTITSIDVVKSGGNDFAEEILHIVDKRNIDTVVLGSRGLKDSKVFLMGGVHIRLFIMQSAP